MKCKDCLINDLYQTIEIIDNLPCHGIDKDSSIYNLHEAIEYIRKQPHHEEFKASWLSVINALNGIDPRWHERYPGDSEWQKLVALINDLYQQYRVAAYTIIEQQQDIATLECASRNDSEIIRGLYERQASLTKMSEPALQRTWLPAPNAVVQEAVAQILEELKREETKRPSYPKSAELAGKILVSAVSDLTAATSIYHRDNGSLERVRREAVRVGAMVIRLLMNLPYLKPAEPDVNAGWSAPARQTQK